MDYQTMRLWSSGFIRASTNWPIIYSPFQLTELHSYSQIDKMVYFRIIYVHPVLP